MTNQKGFTPIFIILGIVVILGMIGGAYYLGKSQQPTLLTNQPLTTPSTTPQNISPNPENSELKSFVGQDNNWTFKYAAALGNATEGFGYKNSQPETKNSGERWWRVTFDKTGFEPGYFVISSTTKNYIPNFWEGGPHWFNTKLSVNDNIKTVEDKLTQAKFNVVKVEETYSKDVKAYLAYTLNCHGGCILERIIILPLSDPIYNNLLIIAVIKGFEFDSDNVDNNLYKAQALEVISAINNKTIAEETKKYIDWQDGIFESLTSFP